MRATNSHRAEMVSEILYGEAFEVLEQQGNWKKITLLHDGYSGWVEFGFECQPSNGETAAIASKPLSLPTATGRLNLYPGSRLTAIEAAQTEAFEKLNLLEVARQYLGVPYYWGGRSLRGIDCSGFVQVVFATQAVSLPRDAYQQAQLGRSISFEEKRAGDLAFFKNETGKITHVGICLADSEIIHASEFVRIDNLRHDGIYQKQSDKKSHQLSHIQRILS